MTVTDACRVLGVAPGCDRARIDTAFRNAALRHHPDRGGDAALLREALQARDVLRAVAPATAPAGRHTDPSASRIIRNATVAGTPVVIEPFGGYRPAGHPVSVPA